MDFAQANRKWAQYREAEATARRAAARAAKLKRELRRFLGADADVDVPSGPKRRAVSKVRGTRKVAAHRRKAAAHRMVFQTPAEAAAPTPPAPAAGSSAMSAAAPGTKGHTVLTVLHDLEGRAPAKVITKRMPVENNRSPAEHRKIVRGYLRYLATKGLVRSVARGLWQITPLGHAALGLNPERVNGQAAMFERQGGHA